MKRTIQALFVALTSMACADRTQPDEPPDLDDAAQRYATQVCEAEAMCQCDGVVSAQACETELKAAFVAVGEVADFDAECFEDLMAAPFWQSCPGGSMLGPLIPDCEVFRGKAGRHAPCEIFPIFVLNTRGACGDGLYCSAPTGQCLENGEFPDFKQLGEPCSADLSNPCFDGYCDGGVCTAWVPEGEGCSDPTACLGLTYCKGLGQADVGVCAPLIEIGGECDPSESRSCLPGADDRARCNPVTGICEAPEPYICAFVD